MDDSLDDIAGAILDGTDVDWARAELAAAERDRPLLPSLRLVAALAQVHREPLDTSHRHGRLGQGSEWGHLRIVQPLGSGAFAQVYLAWDPKLEREVALKLVPVTRQDGMRGTSVLAEARRLARIKHPNVVTIYGADQCDGRVGLWMERIQGATLSESIARGAAFGVIDVVRIGTEVCHAAAALHDAGLLHRDIKAANVMRTPDGRVVLMDLGASQTIDDDGAGAAGTPLYLAPEVLSGAPSSVASDVYSIGVLMYHLLTRHYPVPAMTLGELRAAHAAHTRTPIEQHRPGVPQRLRAVIARALHPDPSHRYANVTELRTALAATERQGYWRAAGIAVMLLAGVAGLVWITRNQSAQPVGSTPAPENASAASPGLIDSRPEPAAILVLPLQNLSRTPDSDYLVDGLTNEIIRRLAGFGGLEVRSQTSTFAFKGQPRNLADIATRLGASLVLEGSVLRDGDRLRVHAQLVRTTDDVALWSERFDRRMRDIFDIQDEIARAIVDRLPLTLTTAARRYDTNLDTYERYLRARSLMGGRVREAERAVELFERVIAEDATFAPAYAGLAGAWAELSFTALGVPATVGSQRIRPAAEKALELDPMLAEAHAAMGLLRSRDLEWHAAEASFRRAIELNPGLASTYVYFVNSTLFPQGRLEESLRYLREAVRADALNLEARRVMANVQISAGRYNDAIANCRQMLAEAPNDYPPLPSLLARALVQAGQLDEAIALHEKVSRLEDGRANYGWLGYAYVKAGRRDEALKLAAASHDVPARQVPIYAALGDRDQAFRALQQMADRREPRVGIFLTYPELAGLRDDARANALRESLRLSVPTAARR